MQTTRIIEDPGELRALGQAIRHTRCQQGTSTADLARTLGIARQHVQAIETGHEDPGYKLTRTIATTLGLTASALLGHAETLQ